MISARSEPIAIVGMRGRFPGAEDLDGFWRNLAEGVESITPLSPDDMRASGVPDDIAALPGYVNAAPLLGDVDMFDAGFFGFSARDASLTDPQHRLFLETAWEALEDAGYDPATYPGAIGVFGGCELSTYLYQLSQNVDTLGYLDGMQLMVTNDKDHLCTQVSYRLDLRGPSVVVQTTCSTSLVAVALACESLQSGRCDMALAGGVTVRVPQRGGYFYVAGSILSPDGHCRPFDANAQGTIVGSGVGLVVLKRLEEALEGGDGIRAVILGVGINNDGSDKVGYTAPGFRGQAAALSAAYESAHISPESVGYIEAHGTGTILGDPIELSALTEVFRKYTDRRGFCGIGAVKSNFGHLSCASGVAGLIKAVLTMEHGAIPPTVHYRSPNPAIDFASSPFYVTTKLEPWERNGTPRRAGVSSFGVGGTNAHAVLEEAPAQEAPEKRRSSQLLVLSARSEPALDEATRRLGAHLKRHPERDLADVAYTLHVGRHAFRHRRSLTIASDDRDGAIDALDAPELLGASETVDTPRVVFMFPGQGSQYPGMAADLYAAEPLVRRSIDHCCNLLLPDLGLDLRQVLFPAADRRETAAGELRDTALAQPALFVVEYALAELWRSWGVQPAAMIGHSIGEFVAATLAGVMELEDALRVLALRGRLISGLPPGSMLAVMAPAEALEDLLDDRVSLAAVNAPGYSVLSGPDPAIDDVEAILTRKAITARRLHTSHAFHSAMMDPILEEFENIVSQIDLSEPTIPYVATLTGEWADGGPTKPEYWSSQIRSTVRFGDGLRALAERQDSDGDAALLEIGPGRTLTTFGMQTAKTLGSSWLAFPSLPAADEQRSGLEVTLNSLGKLWEWGVPVDWAGFHSTEPRRRVSLPTYPFERESYWIGAPVRPTDKGPIEPRDVTEWFYVPTWREAPPAEPGTRPLSGAPVLVMDEGSGVGAGVVDRLRAAGAHPIVVSKGDAFAKKGEEEFEVDPRDPAAYQQLATEVCRSRRLAGVVDCWAGEPPGATDLDDAALLTFLSPLRLAHALGNHATIRPLPMLLVARGTDRVHDDDPLDPPRAFGIGAAKVVPQEHPGFRLAHVDVDADPAVPDLVVAELLFGAAEPDVALRDAKRYVRDYERVPLAESGNTRDLPEHPVVMVTGGLGHMGLILAEVLFARMGARLALVGRSEFPEPDSWEALSHSPDTPDGMRAVLRRLLAMRNERDDVLVLAADLGDGQQVLDAVDAALAHFGRIDILVHGAADVSPAAFGPAAETGPSVVAAQLSPKIRGLLHVMEAMRDREPDLWVLHSSISSALGGLGLSAYAGANAVLDTLATVGGPSWLSIAWDAWDNAAEAQMASIPEPIQPPEGQEAFLRMLATPIGPRVIAAVDDLDERLDAWVRAKGISPGGGKRHPRPNLSTPFAAARTETERTLTEIWASQLGLEKVGIHDRFFDLGGHSLLAVQVASEIRDRFQIEMPVLQLFKAPTISELAVLVEQAEVSGGVADAPATPGDVEPEVRAAPEIQEEGPGGAAKASYREFYDDVTRRLEATGMAEASFFLNYGYVSLGQGDEAQFAEPEGVFNPSSIRLAFELIGKTPLRGSRVLDVGCGRGGTVSLLADRFKAEAVGVDLSPEAVAFCRKTHNHPGVSFEVGDAENLPFEDGSFDVVTNLESSHTYPDIRAFLAEVRRVLRPGGWFLHADLLAGQRWMEVQVLLGSLGLKVEADREITPNVLASCDRVADSRTEAFGERSAVLDNFLAVPGSPVYEQMASGAWEYRILRSRLR
ncbi:MAG: hypothetical protein QOH48_1322 [Actinomycetota bacterium]|nr:hypothetical protein [Actinomycetota bacterium]